MSQTAIDEATRSKPYLCYVLCVHPNGANDPNMSLSSAATWIILLGKIPTVLHLSTSTILTAMESIISVAIHLNSSFVELPFHFRIWSIV